MPRYSPYGPGFLRFGSVAAIKDGASDAVDWTRWYIPRDGKEALFMVTNPNLYGMSRSQEIRKAIDDPTHSIATDGPPTSEHYVKTSGYFEKAAQQIIDFIRDYGTEVGSFWTMVLVSLLQFFWTDPDPLMRYPETYTAVKWRPVVKDELGWEGVSQLGPESYVSAAWDPSVDIVGTEVLRGARWITPSVAVFSLMPCTWTDYNMELNPEWLTVPDPNPHGTRRVHGEDWWPATPYNTAIA